MFDDVEKLIEEAKKTDKLENDNRLLREALQKIVNVSPSSYDDGRYCDTCGMGNDNSMAGDLQGIAQQALDLTA